METDVAFDFWIKKIESKLSEIDVTLMLLADKLSGLGSTNTFVGNKLGFTIQMQQYEPVTYSAWGQVQCDPETKETVFKELKDFLETDVKEVKQSIDLYKKSLKDK